jgi:hypothetical protein
MGVALLLVLSAASMAVGAGTHDGDDVSLGGGMALVTWQWSWWAPEVVWSSEPQDVRGGRRRRVVVVGHSAVAGGGFVVASWWSCSPPPPSDACGLDCGLLSIEQKLSPAFLPVRTMLTPSGADCLTGGIVLVLLSPIWRSAGCQGPRWFSSSSCRLLFPRL